MIKDVSKPVSKPVDRAVNSVLTVDQIFDLAPIAWYMGTDLSDGAISFWPDRSKNDRNLTQPTSSSQPVVSNGTVSFDGIDDYMFVNESFMYSETEGTSVFIVLEVNMDGGVDKRIVSEGSSTSLNPLYCLLQTSSTDNDRTELFMRNDNSSSDARVTTGSNDVLEPGVFKLYSLLDGLNTLKLFVNGSHDTTVGYTRPSPITLDRFSLGALLRTSDSSHADIQVKELIIFHGDMPDSKRLSIEQYLLEKHGLPGFSPLSLSPIAWFDAADSSTITESGGLVSQWDDKSGNGNDATQATASLQPVTGDRTINGLNVIRAPNYRFLNSSFSGALSCCAVVGFTDIPDDYSIAFLGSSVNYSSELFYRLSLGGNIGVSFDGASGSGKGKYSIGGDQLSNTFKGNSSTSVGFGNYVTYSVFENSFDMVEILGRGNLPDITDSPSVAEIIWFDRELTASEKSSVEQYLSNKWGI